MKAILRFKKLQTIGNVAGMEKHVDRRMNVPNADISKTKENVSFVKGSAVGNLQNRLNEIKEGGGVVQKNSVVAIDCLMTASPEWWKSEGIKNEQEFIHRSFDFLGKTFGKENIMSMVMHKDETTPHIHAIVCPAYQSKDRWGNKKMRVGAKKWLDGRKKLSELQDEFAAIMEPLGLERGERKSKAKHQTVQEFYSKVEDRKETFSELLSNVPIKTLGETKENYKNRLKEHLLSFSAIKEFVKQSKIKQEDLVEKTIKATNELAKKMNQDLVFSFTGSEITASKRSLLEQKAQNKINRQKEIEERNKRELTNIIFNDLADKKTNTIDWKSIKTIYNELNQESKEFLKRNVSLDQEYISASNKKAFFLIIGEKQLIESKQESKSSLRNPKQKDQDRGLSI